MAQGYVKCRGRPSHHLNAAMWQSNKGGMMVDRNGLIIGGIVLVSVTLYFDIHLYLFDRPEYLIRRSAEKHVEAQFAYRDYKECKTVGYRDHRCNHFKALYIEKMGEYEQTQSQLDAEIIRNRRK